LNDRLAPGSGWQGIFPGDINDPGQILSDGATRIAGGGVNNAILLTPDTIPVPIRALALHVPGRNGATAGAPLPGVVTLGTPAPTGGAWVTLAASDTSLITPPPGVRVLEGAIRATFTMSTHAGRINPDLGIGWVVLRATYGA